MPAQAGTISAVAAFTTAPDVALDFEPDTWVLKATVGTVDISFDGVNVHLILATADTILALPTKRRKLWARQNGGAATLRWSAISKV